ncbi:receptor serine/threonine kinase [Perilla frutescens var. hirtella]|uniref:Receptor serine/threonine kinase n=1 Tax=Perilla frutescens var. hirtella TaxID=608512 RepID=A0AAD4P6I5_PERFH|nr:receptor serine/threonine kinase [Perilla frutescens var. hirtella]
MSPTKILLLSLLYHVLLFKASSKCHKSYPCGNFSIEFPFTDINHSECGLFSVNCSLVYKYPKVYLETRDLPYDILQKVSPNKFLIHDSVLENYFNSKSCVSFENVSLPQSPFVSFTFSPNLTSFTCFNLTKDIRDYFAQYKNRSCDNRIVYYKTPATHHVQASDHLPRDCVMNQLPMKSVREYYGDLFNLLTPNLSLEWSVSKDCYECYRRGGQCLANNRNEFYCKEARNLSFDQILYLGLSMSAALLLSSRCIFVCIKRKRAKAKQKYDKDIELFLKNNGNLVPMRYKYSSIKKMTNSFSENLGKGGYGTVYKGQLPDGHLVAVKILNESHGNGEEFINEVASISRTSHINIVALLGFCYEGRKTIDRRDLDHTSDTYFPNYIYKQLERDAERDLGEIVEAMSEDESQVLKRNLIIVGLWCIQTNPKDRPSMTKVVEMLEGKLGSLEVPPKPDLYSPPRPASISISISESL